jgi:hypothetical protein
MKVQSVISLHQIGKGLANNLTLSVKPATASYHVLST